MTEKISVIPSEKVIVKQMFVLFVRRQVLNAQFFSNYFSLLSTMFWVDISMLNLFTRNIESGSCLSNKMI